jgi:hypothetical protein
VQAQPAAPVIAQETAGVDAASQVPPSQAARTGTSDFSEVKDAIQLILAQRTASGRSQMRARDLKEELLRRIPNFSERRYGFSKFKALLNAAETAGVLQIDQAGHILWVSAPGTPKMQFGQPGPEDTAQVADTDFEEEADEEATNPAAEAELAAHTDEAAVAAPGAFEAAPAEVTIEPQAAAYPGEEEPRSEVIIPEERTTSLVPGTATETPLRTEVNRAESVLGPRPAQLSQPFFEDVIVLIHHLRIRNRWLGYELLLSNVRDLLSRGMPESEAKIQAGNILSKLLSDGIIKMAIEVHSRGARKMTVKVAHLQEDNPAVRYALENFNLHADEQEAAAQAESTSVEAQTELQEAGQELAALPEGAEASTGEDQSAAQWGSHFTRQARPTSDTEEAESQAAREVQPHSEAPGLEVNGEAGDLGQEAAPVTPEELPEPATEAQPAVQPEGQNFAGAENQGELTGQAVEAQVVEAPGAAPETGENVQGEPDQVGQGEEPAPAGGYINTAELAGETSQVETAPEYSGGQTFEEPTPADQPVSEGQPAEGEQPHQEALPQFEEASQPVHEEGEPPQAEAGNLPEGEQPVEANQAEGYQSPEGQPEGYPSPEESQFNRQPQGDEEGKQAPAEALQPVLELEGEDGEEGDVDEEVEAEADSAASKPARRPRRRRAPRAAAPSETEGPGESLGQPAERRVRLNHHQRPHRRPFSH